jgi:tetratricopeptide (TPR) repeat protein
MQHFRISLCLAVLLACHAESQQTPQPSDAVKIQPIPVRTAPQPPSPDDAPIPDQGATPVPYRSSSPIKRALRRLDPNCLDAIFHLCWSSPPGDDPIYKSYEQKRVVEDLELGDAHMKERNYRGAEFRFEDALQYEPDNPEATFKLAEALQNLGRKNEACIQYKNYLKIEPSGAFSDRAKKCLRKMTPCPDVVTVQ